MNPRKQALWFVAVAGFVLWCAWWVGEPTTTAQSQGNVYPLGLYLNDCADKTAAATVSVDDCNMVRFNGTAAAVTTLNTCSSAYRGRVLHINCDNDATVFDDGGGNLNLARDFTCTADDTLTLACTQNAADAYEWVEIGRGYGLYSTATSDGSSPVATFDPSVDGKLIVSGCEASVGGALTCSAGTFGLISVTDASNAAIGLRINGDETSGSDQFLALMSSEGSGTGWAMNYTQVVESLEAYSGLTGTSLLGVPGSWAGGTAQRVFVVDTDLDLELDNCVSVAGSGGPIWCGGTANVSGACSPNGSMYSDTDGDGTTNCSSGDCEFALCLDGAWAYVY